MTPHVLLDFMKRHLYGEMHLSVKDKLICNKEGLRVYNYWAAQALQKSIPDLFVETKAIPNAKYYRVPSAKYKIPAFPTYKDFGDDTKPDAFYKKLKDALSAAANALRSHAKVSLGKAASKELLFYCNHMVERLVCFVEEVLKYMDSMYRELHKAFDDDSESGSYFLHASVQIMRTTKSFLKVGIRNH